MIETVNDVILIGVRDTYPYSVGAINFLDIETGEDNIVHFDMEDDTSTDVVPLNNKYFKITFYDISLIKAVKKFLKIQDGKIINIVLDFDHDDDILDIFSTKYDDTFLVIGYDPSERKYHIYKIFVYPDGSFKTEEYSEKYLGEYLFPDPTTQTFSEGEWQDEHRGYQPGVPGGIVLYCADKDILYVSNTNYIYAVSGIVDDKPSILYKRKINKLTSIKRTYATGELCLKQMDSVKSMSIISGVVILAPDGEPLYSHYCDKRFLLVGNNNFILSKGSVYSIKERKIVSRYYDFLISTDIISYGGSMSEYNSYVSGEWSNTPSYKVTTTRYRTDYLICIEREDDNTDYIASIYDFRFNKLTKKSFIFPKDKYFEEHPVFVDKYDVFLSMNFFTERWGLCEVHQSTDYGYITSIINTKGEIILIDGKVTAINGSLKPCVLVDNDYSDIAFVILNYSNLVGGSIAFFNYKGEKLYIIDSLFQEIKEYRNNDNQYDWINKLSTSFSNYNFNIFKGDNLFIGILDKTDNKSFHVLYDLKENRIKRIITDE